MADATATAETRPKRETQTWWINGVFVVVAHIIGFASLYWYRPTWQVLVFTFATWQVAGLG